MKQYISRSFKYMLILTALALLSLIVYHLKVSSLCGSIITYGVKVSKLYEVFNYNIDVTNITPLNIYYYNHSNFIIPNGILGNFGEYIHLTAFTVNNSGKIYNFLNVTLPANLAVYGAYILNRSNSYTDLVACSFNDGDTFSKEYEHILNLYRIYKDGSYTRKDVYIKIINHSDDYYHELDSFFINNNIYLAYLYTPYDLSKVTSTKDTGRINFVVLKPSYIYKLLNSSNESMYIDVDSMCPNYIILEMNRFLIHEGTERYIGFQTYNNSSYLIVYDRYEHIPIAYIQYKLKCYDDYCCPIFTKVYNIDDMIYANEVSYIIANYYTKEVYNTIYKVVYNEPANNLTNSKLYYMDFSYGLPITIRYILNYNINSTIQLQAFYEGIYTFDVIFNNLYNKETLFIANTTFNPNTGMITYDTYLYAYSFNDTIIVIDYKKRAIYFIKDGRLLYKYNIPTLPNNIKLRFTFTMPQRTSYVGSYNSYVFPTETEHYYYLALPISDGNIVGYFIFSINKNGSEFRFYKNFYSIETYYDSTIHHFFTDKYRDILYEIYGISQLYNTYYVIDMNNKNMYNFYNANIEDFLNHKSILLQYEMGGDGVNYKFELDVLNYELVPINYANDYITYHYYSNNNTLLIEPHLMSSIIRYNVTLLKVYNNTTSLIYNYEVNVSSIKVIPISLDNLTEGTYLLKVLINTTQDYFTGQYIIYVINSSQNISQNINNTYNNQSYYYPPEEYYSAPVPVIVVNKTPSLNYTTNYTALNNTINKKTIPSPYGIQSIIQLNNKNSWILLVLLAILVIYIAYREMRS